MNEGDILDGDLCDGGPVGVAGCHDGHVALAEANWCAELGDALRAKFQGRLPNVTYDEMRAYAVAWTKTHPMIGEPRDVNLYFRVSALAHGYGNPSFGT